MILILKNRGDCKRMKKEYSQKIKQNLKDIGNNVLNDLEPVAKKTSGSILDLTKEIINDLITSIFESRKKVKK